MKAKSTILIVDDESTNIDYLVSLLKNDYELKVAKSGSIALKILEKFPVDLILLDIYMPQMDGYEVAENILNNKNISNTPIIFLTAKNDENSILKGFKIGAKDYVTKPFNQQELLVRISNHITTYLQTKQIQEQQDMLVQQSKLVAMGEMTSMLAHQWRQPLNCISVLLQEIKLKKSMDLLTNENFDEIYTKIDTSLDYMSSTIDNFRDFFRYDLNEIEYDIIEVIEHVYNILKMKIDSKAINFSINIKNVENHNYCTKIHGKPGEFKQAIINIINNAIEAFEENKKDACININIDCNIDGITIKVEDNAGGIKEEILSKMFEPYVSTKLEQNGTGLGLYMAKMVFEKNIKGSIKGYNKNDGAVFEIFIAK